jgi:hypothetical protein
VPLHFSLWRYKVRHEQRRGGNHEEQDRNEHHIILH